MDNNKANTTRFKFVKPSSQMRPLFSPSFSSSSSLSLSPSLRRKQNFMDLQLHMTHAFIATFVFFSYSFSMFSANIFPSFCSFSFQHKKNKRVIYLNCEKKRDDCESKSKLIWNCRILWELRLRMTQRCELEAKVCAWFDTLSAFRN